MTYALLYLQLYNAEKLKIEGLIRQAYKAALGLPTNTSTDKLLQLGLHNTLDEVTEAHRRMQELRLARTNAARQEAEEPSLFVHTFPRPSRCSTAPAREPQPDSEYPLGGYSAMYYITIIDTVLTLIVPFLLLTVMNFMIARSIYLFYARYRQQRAFCREGHPMRVFMGRAISAAQAGALPNRAKGSGPSTEQTEATPSQKKVTSGAVHTAPPRDDRVDTGPSGSTRAQGSAFPAQGSAPPAPPSQSSRGRGFGPSAPGGSRKPGETLRLQASKEEPLLALVEPMDENSTEAKQNGSGSTLNASQGGSNVVAPATQISVTRMLLLVSTVFVLLNLPSYVLRIYVFLLSFGDAESLEAASGSLAYVLQRYFMILYYTNFAINFVLYNASSRMFRVALCDYVRNRWLAFRNSIVALRTTLTHSSTNQNDDVIT
ncbi:hypothetical protein HPB47_020835 [Ixodes persulcatus]|uniref:Uncharacterized protein n=1 Tax=Ixodes persulcatus TaxID=34615 RepID=A0AC60QGP9_IXOPE|nr:hypothetical protein HPB47_020835 [Ixodes persulcatus]